MSRKVMTGEYEEKREYHRNLDKRWKYYPVYVEKVNFINKYFSNVSKKDQIVDLGCGEGVIVQKYREKGYDIIGLDYNFSSKDVVKGDLTKTKFEDNFFDLVICLDVLEHLGFEQQELAVREMKRIMKKNGRILIAVPNLAHFASRIAFLFIGKLLRTSTPDRHPGDRPLKEYLKIFEDNDLKVTIYRGLFPTYPLSTLLTYFFPSKVVPLHKFLNKFLAYPDWCFLGIIELKK